MDSSLNGGRSSEHFGTLSDGGCGGRADAALDQNGTEHVFILGHARCGRSHEAGPRAATDRSGRTWYCHCNVRFCFVSVARTENRIENEYKCRQKSER